jgi:hypothetical protein
LESDAFVAIEAHARTRLRGAVDAHIRHVIQPRPPLLIEIRIVEERAPVDEIAAKIPDRALDFSLGLRPIWTTGAWRKAPMAREAQELRVADQGAALQPQIARNHRFI